MAQESLPAETHFKIEKQEILNVADELFLSRVVLQDEDLEKLTQTSDGNLSDGNLSDGNLSDDFELEEVLNSEEMSSYSPLSLPLSLMDNQSDSSPRLHFDTENQSPGTTYYDVEIAKLRAQLTTVYHAKRKSDIALERERVRFTETIRGMQLRSKADMNAIRNKQALIEAELPILRQHLEERKEHFTNLFISDVLYQKLKRQPEESLSVLEFVQVKVHNNVMKYRNSLEDLQKEHQKLKCSMGTTKENAELSIQELTHKAKLSEGRENRLMTQLSIAEGTSKELEKRVEQLMCEIEELRRHDKGYDQLLDAKVSLEKQNKKLLEQLDKSSTILLTTTETKNSLEKEVQDVVRKLEIVHADKGYLEKDKKILELDLGKKNREIERLMEKVRSLKQSKDTFYEQLVQVREQHRADYEQKFSEELKKLQDNSRKELEMIRNNGHEIFERENRLLRSARDETLTELDRVRSRLLDVQKSHDDLLLRESREQNLYEKTISDLRNELKMKIFELNQVGMSYEEKMSELRQTRCEADMVKQQMEVMKSEFNKLENEYLQKIAELELNLKNESEKLQTFEELEIELDNAVLTFGNSSNADIPTRPRRRFQQQQHSLLLSQKLARCEKEIQDLSQKLAGSEKSRNEALHDLQKANKKLEHLGQPQNYMVERVHQEEKKCQELLKKLEQTNELLEKSKKEHQKVVQSKNEMQKELQKVLSRRHELETVRNALKNLQNSKTISAKVDTEMEKHIQNKRNAVDKETPVSFHPPPEHTSHVQDSIKESNIQQQRLPKWYFKLREC